MIAKIHRTWIGYNRPSKLIYVQEGIVEFFELVDLTLKS